MSFNIQFLIFSLTFLKATIQKQMMMGLACLTVAQIMKCSLCPVPTRRFLRVTYVEIEQELTNYSLFCVFLIMTLQKKACNEFELASLRPLANGLVFSTD